MTAIIISDINTAHSRQTGESDENTVCKHHMFVTVDTYCSVFFIQLYCSMYHQCMYVCIAIKKNKAEETIRVNAMGGTYNGRCI